MPITRNAHFSFTIFFFFLRKTFLLELNGFYSPHSYSHSTRVRLMSTLQFFLDFGFDTCGLYISLKIYVS